jgi:DNA-binding GntR family transcriptional regulator
MQVNKQKSPLIKRETLRIRARVIVRDRLLEGRLPPTGRINESELSALIGVSRTPLREALLGLEKEGLVVSAAGRGFFVRSLSVEEVREIYPVLWTLESLALQLRGVPSPVELSFLRKINAKLESRLSKPPQALKLDTEWHRTLLRPCRNRRLLLMIRDLKRAAYRYEYAFMQQSNRVIVSVEHHRQIVDALEQGDMERAVETLKENWRVTLECTERWLTST